jgi:hypothetical protein
VEKCKSPEQRAEIYRLVAETSTSAYDIATTDDPFTQVLDLTILATLTSQVWIEGNRAETVFGPDQGERLVRALRIAREEIWDTAARVLRADELTALDFMIAAWRRRNPDVESVSFVRFTDFAEQRGQQTLLEEYSTGFQAVDKALSQMESYERLIERMFYLAKRGPTIVNWQTQAAMEEVLARDETQQALRNLNDVSSSVENISRTTTELSEEVPQMIAREREAIFAEIDRRQKDVDAALEQVKTIAADARATTDQVKATVDATGPLLGEARTTVESMQPTLDAVQKLAETSERILERVAEIKGPLRRSIRTPRHRSPSTSPTIRRRCGRPRSRSRRPANCCRRATNCRVRPRCARPSTSSRTPPRSASAASRARWTACCGRPA